jgi:uncharacterized RDD family membrane protein YckC
MKMKLVAPLTVVTILLSLFGAAVGIGIVALLAFAPEGSPTYCGSCGVPLATDALFCERCGAAVRVGASTIGNDRTVRVPSPYGPSIGSTYNYAKYHAPWVQQSPATPHYKGVGIRYGAVVIDWIVLFFIWVLFFTIISPFYNTPLFWWLAAPCVYLLYFIALEGTYGQTIGKKATRIKVVKEDGSHVSYREAVIRALVGVLDGLPIIIPGLIGCIAIWRSDRKQRIGDCAAHTLVIAE